MNPTSPDQPPQRWIFLTLLLVISGLFSSCAVSSHFTGSYEMSRSDAARIADALAASKGYPLAQYRRLSPLYSQSSPHMMFRYESRQPADRRPWFVVSVNRNTKEAELMKGL